jgi:FkbM family methyltransferase
MLTTKHGHSFLGPLSGVVIDVGCLGFDFSAAAIEAGASQVIAFDLEDLPPPPDSRIHFLQRAVTSLGGERRFIQEQKRNAWRLSPVGTHTTESCSLQDVLRDLSITEIDLLKLDCEGSELEILENLPDCVRQISVEFHLHVWPKQKSRINHLIHHLSGKFDVIQHDLTQRFSGDKWNYWDTLLARKP